MQPLDIIRSQTVSCKVTKSWTPGLEKNNERYSEIYYDTARVDFLKDKYYQVIIEALTDPELLRIVQVENKAYYINVIEYDKENNILDVLASRLDLVPRPDGLHNIFELAKRRTEIKFNKGFNPESLMNLETSEIHSLPRFKVK